MSQDPRHHVSFHALDASNRLINKLNHAMECIMKRNLSNIDRLVRVAAAALFAYLYFAGIVTGTFGVILLVVGAVFALTSIISFCPLYAMFKLSTYRS